MKPTKSYTSATSISSALFKVTGGQCSIDNSISFIFIIMLLKRRYTTSDNVVELKGKVACEISSAEELTLTELMFSGIFKEAKVEELVSLLSCFVWRERLPDAAKPREELDLLFIQLQDTARRVAELQLDCKVFTNTFSPYSSKKTRP